jgi:transcriptional regulator with XRE-family HTH domain
MSGQRGLHRVPAILITQCQYSNLVTTMFKSVMPLNAAQCRMARVALEMGVRDLAKIADVSPNTIARLERGDTLHTRTQAFIRGALEAEGAIFIERGAFSLVGGAGVRLGDGPKSRYADLFERLWTLPDLRRKPRECLAALIDVFALYLDIIEEERREPDVWERLDLNGALNGLANDNPHVAFACLRRGITPPDNQSPDYPIPAEDAAQAEALNLAYFRRCLAQLRARHTLPS